MTENNKKIEWTEMKEKIKSKWEKLADTDIDGCKENMHLIAAKVQSVYGLTKDKAEQEYSEFEKSLQGDPIELENPKPKK